MKKQYIIPQNIISKFKKELFIQKLNIFFENNVLDKKSNQIISIINNPTLKNGFETNSILIKNDNTKKSILIISDSFLEENPEIIKNLIQFYGIEKIRKKIKKTSNTDKNKIEYPNLPRIIFLPVLKSIQFIQNYDSKIFSKNTIQYIKSEDYIWNLILNTIPFELLFNKSDFNTNTIKIKKYNFKKILKQYTQNNINIFQLFSQKDFKQNIKKRIYDENYVKTILDTLDLYSLETVLKYNFLYSLEIKFNKETIYVLIRKPSLINESICNTYTHGKNYRKKESFLVTYICKNYSIYVDYLLMYIKKYLVKESGLITKRYNINEYNKLFSLFNVNKHGYFLSNFLDDYKIIEEKIIDSYSIVIENNKLLNSSPESKDLFIKTRGQEGTVLENQNIEKRKYYYFGYQITQFNR